MWTVTRYGVVALFPVFVALPDLALAKTPNPVLGLGLGRSYGGALVGSTGFVSLNPYLSVGGGISYWRDTYKEESHLYWNAGARQGPPA